MIFSGIIRDWYKKNKRPLPWRQNRDPYRIWLSEIILQQTRVDQGSSYYLKFLKHFPAVEDLAAASEDEVLKHWQGLGYYSRARNLHATAREIAARGGHFPSSYKELLKLKGVGPYTAAAIASIVSGEARAVVDGNVIRVVARLFGITEAVDSADGRRKVDTLAEELMEQAVAEGADPGEHNQAMMEFGSLHCLPRNPDCDNCPLRQYCEACGLGIVGEIPKKRTKQKPRERRITYFVLLCKGETILEKRRGDDIWQGLYQFPSSEEKASLELISSLSETGSQSRAEKISDSGPLLHLLSHQKILASFSVFRLEKWPATLPEGWIKTRLDHLDDYPVPRLLERWMESANFSYL